MTKPEVRPTTSSTPRRSDSGVTLARGRVDDGDAARHCRLCGRPRVVLSQCQQDPTGCRCFRSRRCDPHAQRSRPRPRTSLTRSLASERIRGPRDPRHLPHRRRLGCVSQPTQLRVTVTDQVPTFFLKVFGMSSQVITRTAQAEFVPPCRWAAPPTSSVTHVPPTRPLP